MCNTNQEIRCPFKVAQQRIAFKTVMLWESLFKKHFRTHFKLSSKFNFAQKSIPCIPLDLFKTVVSEKSKSYFLFCSDESPTLAFFKGHQY